MLGGMTDTLTPQELGALGEDIAAHWLCDHHFTILARNVRLPGIRGELDIIAADHDAAHIVFIEVKTRRTVHAGWPEEAITRAKEKTIRLIASGWLISLYKETPDFLPPYDEIRFDVLSLLGNPTKGFEIRHFRDVLR